MSIASEGGTKAWCFWMPGNVIVKANPLLSCRSVVLCKSGKDYSLDQGFLRSLVQLKSGLDGASSAEMPIGLIVRIDFKSLVRENAKVIQS